MEVSETRRGGFCLRGGEMNARVGYFTRHMGTNFLR